MIRKGGGAKEEDGNLDGVLVGEQVDDVEGVLHNADGHQLREMSAFE